MNHFASRRWVCLLAAVLLQAASAAADDIPPPKDPTKLDLPEYFAARSAAEREKLLMDADGNGASEGAVAKGLLWLALHQAPDGRWALDEFSKHARAKLDDKDYFDDKSAGKGMKNDIAGTAFGVLPFLAAGVTHKPTGREKNDRYVKTVYNGLSFLMQKQGKEGGFPGGMYAQALATFALTEAYGMTSDPMLKKPALAAVNFIVAAQDPVKGGWRYQPRQGSDQSVTSWNLMALKSGQMAGLPVPAAVLKKAEKWIDSCKGEDGGYGYTGRQTSATMTASGLLCKMFLGTPRRNPDLVKGVALLGKLSKGREKDRYHLFWAAQVMHHFGGEAWQAWNAGDQTSKGVRDLLIAAQDKDGSWDPKGDPYGNAGGRVMTTSLALLTLEVYYRHPPLFRRDK